MTEFRLIGDDSLLRCYLWLKAPGSSSPPPLLCLSPIPGPARFSHPLPLSSSLAREAVLGHNYKATKFHSDTGSSQGNIEILWVRAGESQWIVSALISGALSVDWAEQWMEQCSSALTKQEIESIWGWPATWAAYNAGGLALVSAAKTEITRCKEKSYFSTVGPHGSYYRLFSVGNSCMLVGWTEME